MIFEKDFLMNNYRQNSDGLNPVEFLEERAPLLIDTWLEIENGTNRVFRQVGPYWEVLFPVLKKYAEDELKDYEKLAGPFENFNEAVRKEYDYKDDLCNFMAVLAYQEKRYSSYSQPGEVHIIMLGEDEIPYMPNRSIDKNQYHGTEN